MKKIILITSSMKKLCESKKVFYLKRTLMFLICLFSAEAYALEVSAGPDKVICQEGETVLEGSASGSVNDSYSFSWEPPEGLTCTDCPDPIADPTVTTEYTLTVEDSGGGVCTDKVIVTVAGTNCSTHRF